MIGVKVKSKEKELKDNFYPECYRIHLDISTININNLINELSKISNIIFDGVMPIAFLRYSYTKKDLTKMLSKKITPEFYCEEIKPEQCQGQNSIVSVFFKEQYENAFAEYIEDAKQNTLERIKENIQKADELRKARIAEAKENQKENN